MKLVALVLTLALCCGCAANKTKLKQGQSFEFRGITILEDGRHVCFRAEVRLDAKSGRQYVQCQENK